MLVPAMVVIITMPSAYADYITMATRFTITPAANGPVLAVTVQNRGDVPAHAVQLEVSIEDASLPGQVVETLGVKERTTAKFPLAGYLRDPGRYPLVIRTYYNDAAGHRFTALIVGFYDYRVTVTPDVRIEGHATTVPVDGRGQVVFAINNDGEATRMLDLALYLPDEMSTLQDRVVVEIGPGERDTIGYELENYSALANSRYPVTLLGRYESDGQRYAIAGTATVRVGRDSQETIKPTWIWFVFGGMLPALIVSLRLHERRARRQSL